MAKQSDPSGNQIRLSEAAAADLRGKQSVRATFRLTEGCINAISVVAAQLGIKQKSLFDHLVEDIEFIESIARAYRDHDLTDMSRIQKTFVISRKTLLSLDQISREHNAPRDVLIEFLARRLLPVIETEKEKHRRRKAVSDDVENHFEESRKLLAKMRKALDEDDPVYQRFEMLMSHYANTVDHIRNIVEKGEGIESVDTNAIREEFPGT